MMTETILKIRLDELKTVRVRCANKVCGGWVEIDISHLHKLGTQQYGACGLCGVHFIPPTGVNMLGQLQMAISGLLSMREPVEIEFPIPVPAELKK